MFLVFVLLAIVSCDSPQVDELRTVSVDGITRKYHLFVPSGTPTKLMFLIHDIGQNLTTPLVYWKWQDLAEANNIVLAIPEARNIPCKNIEAFGQTALECYDGEGVRWDIDHILTGITLIPEFKDSKACVSNDLYFLKKIKDDLLDVYSGITKTFAVAQGNGAKFLVQTSTCLGGELVDSMYIHMGGIGQVKIEDVKDLIPEEGQQALSYASMFKITSVFWPLPLPVKSTTVKAVPILQTHVNFTIPKQLIPGVPVYHPDDTSSAVNLMEMLFVQEIKGDLYMFPDEEEFYKIHPPLNAEILAWLEDSLTTEEERRSEENLEATTITSFSQLGHYTPVGKYDLSDLQTKSFGDLFQEYFQYVVMVVIGIVAVIALIILLCVCGCFVSCCCCLCSSRRRRKIH